MVDPEGFIKVPQRDAPLRAPDERIGDWHEVYAPQPAAERARDVAEQASRCMDCGVPFCHSDSAGCPLGNLIPEWNDLVSRHQWSAAADRLHSTNNFPEFTGRLCPAPCESACVLAIDERSGGSVTIKRIEREIADAAWEADAVPPRPARVQTGRTVAVVGSGPAGLAAAQQLTRAGHQVTVFERDDRLGGLMRYGIPEFKLDRAVLGRRLDQMHAEGTRFRTGCEVGVDPTAAQLRSGFDAVVLAVGALRARDDAVPGRDLVGVHLAMDYLVRSNRECEGDGPTAVSAQGKHVVIIGGGDTGADCLGTAHRQGAASVTQLDYHREPPAARDEALTPWPSWPLVLRITPAHAEGGTRRFEVAVRGFVGDAVGRVRSVAVARVAVTRTRSGRSRIVYVGGDLELPCGLALLAIGFEGVERGPLLDDCGLRLNSRGALSCGPDWQTGASGVFVCGDAHRGASLVVWAIAEGRSAARAVDVYLTGHSDLPAPVHPMAVPLTVR
ncbi:glutamate synthase subunit beta [Rhodococcus kronopolitis]|uniref:Glutamate synthase subunit beta n=1 Tax=Rhodococcus kronopolitis TaxID=1460226 RepID=A0ABV9FYG6_9NOCA